MNVSSHRAVAWAVTPPPPPTTQWFVLALDPLYNGQPGERDDAALDRLAAGLRLDEREAYRPSVSPRSLLSLIPVVELRRQVLREILEKEQSRLHMVLPGPPNVPADCRFFARRDARGRLTGVLCFIEAVAHREDLEQALRQTEAQYRGIFETAADALLLVGLDGRVRDANPAACAMYGFSREAFIGKFGREFIHPDSAAKFRDAVATVSRGECFSTQSMDVRHDGTAFPVEVRISPFALRGEQVMLCAIRDVTERESAALSLRQSESMYRALFENALDAIFLADCATGQILDANRRAQELTGRPVEELRTMHQSRLHPPEMEEEIRGLFATASSEPGRLFLLPLLHRSGQRIAVEIGNALVALPGNRQAVFGIFRDVSERERTESALRESRAHLARAQSVAHIGSWEWPVGENIIRCSDELYRIFGRQPGRPAVVTAEMFLDHVHPEDRPALRDLIADALAGRRPYRTEYRIRRPDGDVRHVRAIGETVRDESGRGVRMYGTVQDVTELHQAEEAVRENHERFSTIMDSVNALIYVADMETHEVLYMNRQGHKLFPGAVGRACWQTIQTDQEGPCSFCTNSLLLGPDGEPTGTHVWEFENTRTGNWYQCNDRAIRWSDGRYVRLEIALDITERKRAEEQVRQLNDELESRVAARTSELASAVRELESFSYSASHDLRTPLRAIEGFSALLEADYSATLDAQGADYVRRIRRAAQHMAQLIDDLLDLARLSRRPLRRRRVDLSALAANIVADLREQDPQREVVFDLQPGIAAKADPTLIRVVLANLLENAWKFTGRTSAPHISFGSLRTGGKRTFMVRDNGAGFDMAFAGKLFGAFQRLHGASEYEGTGIGLATVQRIVQRHGGRVWAEAEIGRGATFYFTLDETAQASS